MSAVTAILMAVATPMTNTAAATATRAAAAARGYRTLAWEGWGASEDSGGGSPVIGWQVSRWQILRVTGAKWHRYCEIVFSSLPWQLLWQRVKQQLGSSQCKWHFSRCCIVTSEVNGHPHYGRVLANFSGGRSGQFGNLALGLAFGIVSGLFGHSATCQLMPNGFACTLWGHFALFAFNLDVIWRP